MLLGIIILDVIILLFLVFGLGFTFLNALLVIILAELVLIRISHFVLQVKR